MSFTALVMAGSRRGGADPVARACGLSHKALAPVAGVPMLTRVLRCLRESPAIGRIFVSIEEPGLLDAVPDGDLGRFVQSRGTLTESAVAAAAAIPDPWPLLVTTADSALLTPEIVALFTAASVQAQADVTVAMTPAEVVLAKYPTGMRAFHRFRDGAAAGCNLYALMNPRALAAAQAFAGGGQFGKRPWRVLRAFGATPFLLHLARRLTLDAAMARVGRAFSLNVKAVRMPIAEAAIDIDSAADLALAETILRR